MAMVNNCSVVLDSEQALHAAWLNWGVSGELTYHCGAPPPPAPTPSCMYCLFWESAKYTNQFNGVDKKRAASI